MSNKKILIVDDDAERCSGIMSFSRRTITIRSASAMECPRYAKRLSTSRI